MAIIVTVPVVISTVATFSSLLLYENAPLLSLVGGVNVNSGSPNTLSISGKLLKDEPVVTLKLQVILEDV
jgi:hypothetical protein